MREQPSVAELIMLAAACYFVAAALIVVPLYLWIFGWRDNSSHRASPTDYLPQFWSEKLSSSVNGSFELAGFRRLPSPFSHQ